MHSRVHLDNAPFDDLLATYVRDHLAGSAGGHALTRRAAGTIGELDPEAAATLGRSARNIGED